jgi:hypothetical protein
MAITANNPDARNKIPFMVDSPRADERRPLAASARDQVYAGRACVLTNARVHRLSPRTAALETPDMNLNFISNRAGCCTPGGRERALVDANW